MWQDVCWFVLVSAKTYRCQLNRVKIFQVKCRQIELLTFYQFCLNNPVTQIAAINAIQIEVTTLFRITSPSICHNLLLTHFRVETLKWKLTVLNLFDNTSIFPTNFLARIRIVVLNATNLNLQLQLELLAQHFCHKISLTHNKI